MGGDIRDGNEGGLKGMRGNIFLSFPDKVVLLISQRFEKRKNVMLQVIRWLSELFCACAAWLSQLLCI